MKIKQEFFEGKVEAETNKQVGKLVNDLAQNLLSNLSKKLLREVVAKINEEWVKLAREKLSGDKAKYLQRYLNGIQPATIEGDNIRLRLQTFDAVKIERGWAPPQNKGSTISDGIGKYDGTPKDLRPLLLWSGKQPKITKFKGKFKRKKGRRPGKKPTQSDNAPKVFWKVIKFDIAESQSDVESVFTDWLDAKVQEAAKVENLTYDENKKKYKASFDDMDAYGLSEVFKNELSRAVSLAKSRRNRGRKGGAGEAYIGGAEQLSGLKFSTSKSRDFDPIPLPATKTVLWSETMKSPEEIEHRSHIFERMRVKAQARKVTFSTFRTITEGSGVRLGSRNRWRAVGIPPAYIIAGDPQKNDLVHRVAAILTGVGMKNVLRASTNLAPKSITQAPVVTVKQSPTGSVTSSVSKSVTPASMPAPSPKTSTVSKQTPTTVAATAAATAASSAATVAPPPTTALTLEDQIMEKARSMAARDHPNVPGHMWDKFGNDYISFARSILTKERVK